MAEDATGVLSEIRRILKEELAHPKEAMPDHHLLADLQLDSLGLTVLAVELENRFRIRLEIEGPAEVGTVADVIALVLDRTRKTRLGGDPC